MYDFHTDKSRYFQIQYKTSREYIIPFVEKFLPDRKPLRILEIGCAEAGVLKAFTERGDICLGIELNEGRIRLAREYMSDEIDKGLIDFLNSDIYDINPEQEFDELFDVVILKDVIEHIPQQEKFIPILKKFIKPDGLVFFAFPPWHMPFGGHQQIAINKWASKLPYYHILPVPLYKRLLKLCGESEEKIAGLLNIKKTGITIERFERIINRSGWQIVKRKFWLFNPIYQWKFGINPREQLKLFSTIPLIRNFYTTAMYYVVKKN